MHKTFSLYLDGMRFFAAFVVLLSHFAYRRFTDGTYLFIREWNLGSDAVILFFVLSGLVIAYTRDTRDKTLGLYAFNRLTRIYSVAFPALLLTLLLDLAGQAIAPREYDGWWYQPMGGWETLAGLTFSTQWLFNNLRMGTNGPYWSLSYEAAYYLLFGVWAYMRGAPRYCLLLILPFIIGPKVMLLLPSWLMGVWVYRRITAGRLMERRHAWIMACLPIVIYILCLYVRLPGFLIAWTADAFGTSLHNIHVVLAFSDEFLWNNLLGVLVACHFIGMHGLLPKRAPDASRRWVGAVRWLAGVSFSLYLVHYPALMYIDNFSELLPYKFMRDAALLSATLALCFAFAMVTELKLKPFREQLLSRLRYMIHKTV